jgi:hypothetical protein
MVITDVTRMQGERLCIAGIDRKATIRLAEPHPTTDLVATLGGLAPGDVISLQVQPVQRYRPPHKEDSRWLPSSVQRIEHLCSADLYDRIAPMAFASVTEAFGRIKYISSLGNPVFPTDHGKRSLASLKVRNVTLHRVANGLRADFEDSDRSWEMLPVEGLDLRLHLAECADCSSLGRLRMGEAIVRLGLGRPYTPDGQDTGCFAQLNSLVTRSGDIHAETGAQA